MSQVVEAKYGHLTMTFLYAWLQGIDAQNEVYFNCQANETHAHRLHSLALRFQHTRKNQLP